MISLTLAELADRAGARLDGGGAARVEAVSTSSKLVAPGALFVALRGQRSDGHRFVAEAARAGAAAALVEEGYCREVPDNFPLLRTASPLGALQRLAAWYRRAHLGRVVAVTGSNGKTVTKEALVRFLRASGREAAASPGSYNSQLGVALALLGAPAGSALGVFEAGVSAPGEMEALRRMLAPDDGILTNIGLSHIAAFRDQRHLASEKASLFEGLTGFLLVPDEPLALAATEGRGSPRLLASEAEPRVEAQRATGAGFALSLRFDDGQRREVLVRTRSPELAGCVVLAAKAARRLGLGVDEVAAGLDGYAPPPTRMEVWRSPGGVTLVNDAHSSDPLSVRAALRATASLGASGRKIFVFGGMGELGALAADEHRAVGELSAEQGFRHLVLLDSDHADATAEAYLARMPGGQVLRSPADALPRLLGGLLRSGDVVLLKAPRAAGIAEAAGELFGAMAPSRLLVDLHAVGENIASFRARAPGVKILAVVKALAYGSALAEMAQGVGRLPVDWLGVTTADEGAQLRAGGVELPVLVTLVTADEASKIARHRLTAAVAAFSQIEPLSRAAREAGVTLDVHLKVDTGMGRLGVLPHEALPLARAVASAGSLRITGLMTHFSCADDPALDALTRRQIELFDAVRAQLADAGFSGLLTHASASAAAARFPEARYDMLRLGLALHGVAASPEAAEAVPLSLAVSLVSRIALVREVPRGWTIGYGATRRADRDPLRMGVIPLGYHDGLPRSLSNRGWALVEGQRAPMLGRVSMDSVLVDLSDIPAAHEGSDALLFGRLHGHELRPEALAEAAGTIAYELLARIGPRVQRIYVGALACQLGLS